MLILLRIFEKTRKVQLEAWGPRIISRLIDRATRRLPVQRRLRQREEWQSHIDETPGDIPKVLEAIGFLMTLRTIAREIAHQDRFGADYAQQLARLASFIDRPDAVVRIQFWPANTDPRRHAPRLRG
jgi:hypothetical protein